jgi:uracil-DNA glycosylase
MKPAAFVDALSAIHLDDVFNPYSDRCLLHDRADAPQRRRANLLAVVEAAAEDGIDSMWIARDLGYRGGRRTGLPLTDEIHLETFSEIYGGLSLSRATKGPPVAERTAAIIWKVLAQIDKPVFLWNIFPLHPFEPGEPLSNRCHTRAEREVFRDLLFTLLKMLRPKNVIAIGRDAQHSLLELEIDCQAVRHPSYGGQSEFIRGMNEQYDLPVQLPH